MKTPISLLVAVLLSVAIAGCNLDVPSIASVTCTRYVGGSPGKLTPLSSSQIRHLTEWFASHRSGWSQSVVTYVPVVELRIEHGNGTASVVNVGPLKIVIYGSFGQSERTLSEAEANTLLRVLQDGA
jgi:hypothetical protein